MRDHGTAIGSTDARPRAQRNPPGPRPVVAREDGFDFASMEYRDLYARSDATLFQHPDWLHRLYTVLAPRLRAAPVVLTVRAGGRGRLLAVLPLVRRRRHGMRMLEYADLGVCDHAAPVLDRDAVSLVEDPALAHDLWRALSGFDLLRIERIVDSPGPLASALGTRVHRRHPYGTHVVALPDSVEAWQERLNPAFVRHLQRKRKRLRPKGGLTLRRIVDPVEVDLLLDDLCSFRRDRFSERGGVDLMQDPHRFAFYRAVALDGVTGAGPVDLSVLDVGDDTAAVALDVADGDRHAYLVVGYDFGRLRNYSLGLLIVDELARRGITEGVRHLDLTVGDEPYKADFGASPSLLWSTRRARTLRGALGGLMLDLEAWARRTAKAALTHRAG